MEAGLDELKEERMPSKAIRIQELRRVSGSPVVMAAGFITSFLPTEAQGQIRLASDGEAGRKREGRVGE